MKLPTAIALISTICTGALAQGIVNFANVGSGFNAPVYSEPRPGGGMGLCSGPNWVAD